MGYAIKMVGKQAYVAKQQFNLPGGLAIAVEGDGVFYHPMIFDTKEQAEAYFAEVVKKTRGGRRNKWEIVPY